jgi:predicted regulator of amino acid metabolism with ACT domain
MRIDGYRFFFFSDEHTPKHIHVEKGDGYIRIELESLEITDKFGVNAKEVKKIIKLVSENKNKLKGAWDEYFKEN